ncbi:MAG: YdcF family protein [Pseudomonadota bacterium]|nr:YdcF family protein [Pseudomonadota bacterium]
MTNFKKIILLFLLVILAGFMWWVIFLFNILPKNYYSKSFPNNSFNTGVVVLTGGKMRIERGMEILQKGYADKMFISGVFMPSEIEMKFNIEKSKKDLLACCINFGQKAKNTIENAFETDNWLKKNSEIQKVILITSYYHLPRSILIFKKKIQSNPEIYAVPAVEKVNLFEQPLFHVKLITSEYFKVIYTLLFVK